MTRGATARLFVAVDPPAEVCEELAEWAREAVADWRSWTVRRPRRPLRPPRLLAAEALHLTLCFLGSRPVGEIAALSSALGLCSEDAGELSVGAPLWLPPRRPHALAVEIRDRSGALEGLQASLTRTLSDASDWDPERRRFRPHITLVRVREGAAPARGASGSVHCFPPRRSCASRRSRSSCTARCRHPQGPPTRRSLRADLGRRAAESQRSPGCRLRRLLHRCLRCRLRRLLRRRIQRSVHRWLRTRPIHRRRRRARRLPRRSLPLRRIRSPVRARRRRGASSHRSRARSSSRPCSSVRCHRRTRTFLPRAAPVRCRLRRSPSAGCGPPATGGSPTSRPSRLCSPSSSSRQAPRRCARCRGARGSSPALASGMHGRGAWDARSPSAGTRRCAPARESATGRAARAGAARSARERARRREGVGAGGGD